MPANQRASLQEIISSYEKTQSIWKTAKELGLCGQSVWERLKACDYKFTHRKWDQEELEEREQAVIYCINGDWYIEAYGHLFLCVEIKHSINCPCVKGCDFIKFMDSD